MTTKEFLDAGIESAFDMIGSSWNGRIGHEAKKIGDGVVNKRLCPAKFPMGVPPTAGRRVRPFLEKQIVFPFPVTKGAQPPSLLSFGSYR